MKGETLTGSRSPSGFDLKQNGSNHISGDIIIRAVIKFRSNTSHKKYAKIPTYLESFQLHPVCPKQLPITRISQQLLKLLRILQHVSHTTHALTCIVIGRSLNPPTPNPIRAQAKKVTFFIRKLKRLTIGWRKERTLCVYYDNNQLRTWPDTRTLSRTLLKEVESWVNSPFLPLLQGCLTSAPPQNRRALCSRAMNPSLLATP